MEIFTPKNYSNTRSLEPMITIGLKGLMTFNRAFVEKLELSPGQQVSFGKRIIQNEIEYCLFIDENGFILRRSSSKSLCFNAKQFVAQLTKDLDLALSEDRKKSVRFNVQKDIWEDTEVWKLV